MPGRKAGDAGTAGASAWARYRALAAEYRRERIVVRLVLASAVAVVALGVAEWRAGLAAAVIAVAAHVLYERNRSSPAADWRRGACAERRTGRRLDRLGDGYRVLHDRALPDIPATNVDHLVIGLTGIYAVMNRQRARTDDRAMATLSASAQRIAVTVGDLLSKALDYEVTVVPVVAVHRARLPDEGLRHHDVVFRSASGLARFVEEQSAVFTSAQVVTIVAAADRELPPMVSQEIRK